MVGKYLWGTLQARRMMDEFLHSLFYQNHEVALHINLYLFEDMAPRVELVDLR